MSNLNDDLTTSRTVSVTTCNKRLIEAVIYAAKLLVFLSHHLRGRLPDAALLDMAEKADKLTFELRKFK